MIISTNATLFCLANYIRPRQAQIQTCVITKSLFLLAWLELRDYEHINLFYIFCE